MDAFFDDAEFDLKIQADSKPKKSKNKGKKQKPTPKEKKFGIAKLKSAEENFVAKNKLFDNENHFIFPGQQFFLFPQR